jgi:hypothetical protein
VLREQRPQRCRVLCAERPCHDVHPLWRVGALRGEWEAWSKQSLADLNIVYLYLDAIALRVRAASRVTGLPVLAGVAVP